MSDARTAKILVADDEPLFLRTTGELLRNAGYECTCVGEARAALAALADEPFDLVLSDLNMPGNLCLELLREGRAQWPSTPLIVVTGVPSLPTAIESVRLGITDYLLKPVSYNDLLASVRRALSRRVDRRPNAPRTTSQQRDLARDFPEIVGASPPMLELFDVIDRVSQTETNVLITGESGTGKEVVARAIHRRSQRAAHPFQVIDCTAIPETLFESILFGHVKGSFTGAIKDQRGLLHRSEKGTVFFDEIGELPTPLQAKLLRAVQEQTYIPVGDSEPLRFDARIICATNRDLELEVNAGRFRRDLYYRLAVIHVELPPLRNREGDVPPLVRHFFHEFRAAHPHIEGFAPEVMARLRAHAWPGNIRELRNVVESSLAMARSTTVELADLPPALRDHKASGPTIRDAVLGTLPRDDALDAAERDYLLSLLRQNAGNVSRSARFAGMSRQGLHKLLKRHGISRTDYLS